MKLNLKKQVPVIPDTNLGLPNRRWRGYLIAGTLAVCSVGNVLSIVQAQATNECVIDLSNNTHTCNNVSAITFISQPNNNQAVIKITLDPSSGYTKAVFDVTYDAEPTGWTVDICDSKSCNGYGGDAGDTSNAAEVEVLDTSFNAYRNTLHGAGDPMKLFGKSVSITPGTTISLEVSDEHLGWNFPNENGELCSDRLFTLNGQIPTYGTVDYDIYAAFNRVISGSRNGSGASSVNIKLLTDEFEFPDAGVDGTQSAAKFKVTLTQDAALALKGMGKMRWVNGHLEPFCSSGIPCPESERYIISPTLYEKVTKIGRSGSHWNQGNPYNSPGSGVDTDTGTLICETGSLNANTCNPGEYFPDRVTDYWFDWEDPVSAFSLSPPYQADGNAFDEGPTNTQSCAGPEEVHTRIVSMNLTALPVNNPASADVLRAGSNAPCQPPSVGEVESLDDDGTGFPAESFFHMYVEVDVDIDRDGIIDMTVANASGPRTGIDKLTGGEPLVVENGQLNAFPPTVVYTHTGSNDANDGNLAPKLYRIDKNSCAIGMHIGWIRIAAHGMNFGQPVSQRKRTLREGSEPPRSIEEFEEIFNSLQEMPIEPGTDCPCLPISSFTASPMSGEAPLEVTLDASTSSDLDGTIVSYTWAASNGNTANGVTTTMTFAECGIYTITLTVTDNDGNTASTSQTIKVVGEDCEDCEGHATYSAKNGFLHIPYVDMPTVPMIGGNHTPSQKTAMVEATLQLIQPSNLFEIEEVKLTSSDAQNQCHATYSLDGKLHIPYVDVPLVTILNGVPVPLGVDTYDATLQLIPFSDLFTIESVTPIP